MRPQLTVVTVLFSANTALIVVYLYLVLTDSQSATLLQFFDLDREATVASWYTSALLLLSGAGFFGAARKPKSIDDRLAMFFFGRRRGFRVSVHG